MNHKNNKNLGVKYIINSSNLQALIPLFFVYVFTREKLTQCIILLYNQQAVNS